MGDKVEEGRMDGAGGGGERGRKQRVGKGGGWGRQRKAREWRMKRMDDE